MLQAHACVSVHCDQCGDTPGGPGFEAHYPTEAAALDAAAAAGWVAAPEGRLWCSTCGPILTCERQGHEFTAWHRATSLGQRADTARCGCDPVAPVHPLGSPRCGREFRYCRRCCVHESRTATAVA
jgi:hypothetical protein